MGFFTPHKRHANEFNYTPRYYDPAKEERELRRAELHGERLDDKEEYTPGKYIKAKREAREARAAKKKQRHNSDKRMNMLNVGIGLILVAVVIFILIPRLGEIFELATSDHTPQQEQQQMQEYKEFNPYTPIVIVPNDYQEGDEIEIVE